MLPDAWETANFGDLTHDGSADTDSDGLSDYTEYTLGTDPNTKDNPNMEMRVLTPVIRD